MFKFIAKSHLATLAVSVFANSAVAQSTIPLRYGPTTTQIVTLPYQVTKVESAEDLGSDLFRIWIPGYLSVATAPNEHFNNWPNQPGGNQNFKPMKFQVSGTITVQGQSTPMTLLMPGHLHGAAALPAQVPVGTALVWAVETRDSTGAPFTGHKFNVSFFRRK